MKALTPRQQAVYEFLRTAEQIPSVREIMEHFGMSSPNGPLTHLKALERKGYVRRPNNEARSMWVKGRAVVDLDLIETGTEIEIGNRRFILIDKEDWDSNDRTFQGGNSCSYSAEEQANES